MCGVISKHMHSASSYAANSLISLQHNVTQVQGGVCTQRPDHLIPYDTQDTYKTWLVYDVSGNVFCHVLTFHATTSLVLSKRQWNDRQQQDHICIIQWHQIHWPLAHPNQINHYTSISNCQAWPPPKFIASLFVT